MRHRTTLSAAFATIGLLWALPAAQAAEDPALSERDTFWIVPHTHWEGAVFKTREEYLQMGLPNILKALHLLNTQPSFHFTLDQVAYVRPFLERNPELEADFRRFVREGKLQLAGALDVMPDVNMPGGETFVRQMLYGKGYYREKLGVDVTAAWLIDTFGHHAQMPQLLTLGGFKTFWFSRGVPRPDHPSEFLWEGIDGTRIPAYWLPYSYGLLHHAPKTLPEFRAFVQKRFDMLTPNARGKNRVGLAGADVSEPDDHLAAMVEAYNREADAPLALRLAVPAEFEKVTADRAHWPVFKGELNPIFQGTYSSRIEIKERMRTLERLLTTAEKLAVLADWLGQPADVKSLWRAWEPVLFNETHDLSSGVMTDHVYADTMQSYAFSQRLAEGLIDAEWSTLAARIDTSGEGTPVVVFNTLGWPRTDVVETELGFDEGGLQGFSLVDSAGHPLKFQVLDTAHYADGALKSARIAFLARNIPALGYEVYRVISSGSALPEKAEPAASGVLENELYRIDLDRSSGAMTGLEFKPIQWQALAGPANVVSRQEDKGDLWELYRGLDGGSKIAMTQRQPVPKKEESRFSSEFSAVAGTLRSGPVFSEFQVAHPFDSGAFATTVRLAAGMRRIEITTKLVNNEKFVRYQALFPTSVQGGTSVHEIPFGAIERPAGIEFPAQSWVDYGDGKRGVALLNLGLPGNVVSDGTLMLSLLRSHNLGGYGFGGGYEPGMSSETGFQIGQERTLRYALVPHDGDWRGSGIFREAMEFSHPLLCRKVAPHGGTLKRRWGLLEVSNPNVVVSTLKPGRTGAAILRVYEATGQAAVGVKVTLSVPVRAAIETDLLETGIRELKPENGSISFDLHPFEIKSFELRLGPLASAAKAGGS